MLRVGVFVALLVAFYDVKANPATNSTVPPVSASSTAVASSATTSSVDASSATTSATLTSTIPFFATPPASLGVPADFTAGPFFATDFLQAFFPGFGPTQTSVEPQPLITDPVVSIFDKSSVSSHCLKINSLELSFLLTLRIPKPSLPRMFRIPLYFLHPN